MVLGLGAILLSSFLLWNVFYLKDTWGLPMQWTVIASAIFLGIGITTAQITSSAFASDLIGQNTVRRSGLSCFYSLSLSLTLNPILLM